MTEPWPFPARRARPGASGAKEGNCRFGCWEGTGPAKWTERGGSFDCSNPLLHVGGLSETCAGLGHVRAITHLKRSWELCDEPHAEDAPLPSQSRGLPVETEGSAGPGGEGGAACVGTVVSAVGLGVLRGRAV